MVDSARLIIDEFREILPPQLYNIGWTTSFVVLLSRLTSQNSDQIKSDYHRILLT